MNTVNDTHDAAVRGKVAREQSTARKEGSRSARAEAVGRELARYGVWASWAGSAL